VLAGGNRCTAGDTNVWTDRGVLPVSDVRVGDKITCVPLSEEGNYDVVDAVYISDHPEKIYRLTLKNGMTLRGNIIHPVLVRRKDDGVVGWSFIGLLHAGDSVCTFECADFPAGFQHIDEMHIQDTQVFGQWSEVDEVVEDGEEIVYGLLTRYTHTYLTNNIVSHNSGKTYGGMMEVIPYLFWIGTTGWVVSATYDLAEELRRKIEDILIGRAGMERVNNVVNLEPWQFTYSIKTHTLTMGTGSTLMLKSADSPNSMHAIPLDYVLIDEAALLPYSLYDTRIVPRLADAGGWVLSMGTFEWLEGEWFEEYFDIGQSQNDLGIESWHHPTEDNYHVYVAKGGETPEDIGSIYHVNFGKVINDNKEVDWPLKAGQQIIIYNIDKAWLDEQKKRMRPEVFASRFEAKRASNPFQVFPTWDQARYNSRERASFDKDLPVYLAIDPGGTYAVAVLQLKKFSDVGTDNAITDGYSLCIIDELYYQTTITTNEVFAAASRREWWPNVSRFYMPHWDKMQGAIDVTAKEQQRTWEFLARKDDRIKSLHLMAMKVNRQPGIQTLQHFLDTDSIYVNPKCVFWNTEMRRWSYPQPSLMEAYEDPRKGEPVDAWNHLTKAVIYFIVNKFGYFGKSSTNAKVSKQAILMSRQTMPVEQSAVVSRYR